MFLNNSKGDCMSQYFYNLNNSGFIITNKPDISPLKFSKIKEREGIDNKLISFIDIAQFPKDLKELIKISKNIYPVWVHEYIDYTNGFSLDTLNILFSSQSEYSTFEDWITNNQLELDLYLVRNFEIYIKYSSAIYFKDNFYV